MFRYFIPASLLAVVAVMLGGLCYFAGMKSASADLARQPRPSKARALRELLARPIDLEKEIEPNTPLKEALDFLAERHGFTYVFDRRSFDVIGVQKVEEQAVQLPRLKGVPLSEVLRLLLTQLKGEAFTGCYLVRPGYLEITSTWKAMPEMWVGGLYGRPDSVPTVQASFHGTRLDEVLEDLAEQSGITIVLDRRVTQAIPVTATFAGARVDRAVQLVADMADLQAVSLLDVIYVTSRGNARDLQEQDMYRRSLNTCQSK
jgi:hypothetical protein